jgi:fructose-1-phosphate kinase PfkB-like protein
MQARKGKDKQSGPDLTAAEDEMRGFGLARTAQPLFEELNGGPFTGTAKEVQAMLRGAVKAALKADGALTSVRKLVNSFGDGRTFFPNNCVKAQPTKGNGGIIGVNTFPLLCQNYHLRDDDGTWSFEDASNTVGGDPTMPLIQAAALGHHTHLITLAADDEFGHAFVDRIQEMGVAVHPVWVGGQNPIQFNFASNGVFMGGIRLRKMKPIPAEKLNALSTELNQTLTDVRGRKIILVGGASNSVDDQGVFGRLMNLATTKRETPAYDLKDSHIGEPGEHWKVVELPIVANLMQSNLSKPNEGEAYLLEQLLAGRRDLADIRDEARNTGLQKEYWEKPERLVHIYNDVRELLRCDIGEPGLNIGTMMFTLGAEGVVTVDDDLKHVKYPKQPMNLLTSQGLSIRSPQGGGNAFWAQVMIGLSEDRPLSEVIPEAQAVGLMSTYQLGNGCAHPDHVARALAALR